MLSVVVQAIRRQEIVQDIRDLVVIHIRKRAVRAPLEAEVLAQEEHLGVPAVLVDQRGHLPRLPDVRIGVVPVVPPHELHRRQLGQLLELLERHDEGAEPAEPRPDPRVVREDVPHALVHD